MDELEFRRRAITHPSDRDPAFLKAAEASPANRKHLDEMQQLERQVRSTLEVDVPAGLAERILLRQAMAAEEEQVVPLPVTPARTQWRALAIAASVAFLVPRAEVPALLARIAPIASRAVGVAVVPTGPWPAYSFVPVLDRLPPAHTVPTSRTVHGRHAV